MPFRDKRVECTRTGGRARNSVLIGIFVHCPTARHVLTYSPPAAHRKSPNPILRHSIPRHGIRSFSTHFPATRLGKSCTTNVRHACYLRPFFPCPHMVVKRKSSKIVTCRLFDKTIRFYDSKTKKFCTYVYVELHKRPYRIVFRDRSLALWTDTRWNTRKISPVRFVPDANSNTKVTER